MCIRARSIPATDLAIVAGRFAYCGPDASHAIGQGTKVVDAGGRYLVPGFATGICMSKAAW